MTEDIIFELRDGHVILDSTPVLEGVDFRLEPGEFLALLGSNGSGKTTLVRTLLGLVPLASGSIRVFGRPLGQFQQWHRIGYVPQRFSAASGAPASVMEVVLSGRVGHGRRLRRYAASDRHAARQALETLGLEELVSAPVAHLSGGQQQRVLIARALATEPDALVLDEPIAGVDLEHQESLAGTLRTFNASGGSVLLVAHGLGVMEELISREVVMHVRKVRYDGPHHADHIHTEQIHHPEPHPERSPLDRAAGAR